MEFGIGIFRQMNFSFPSIGKKCWDLLNLKSTDLIEVGDRALYQAKSNRRNCFFIVVNAQ